MLKTIYEFIDNNVRRNYMLQGICAIIFFVIGFLLSLFYMVDSTPATENDYAPLIEQNSAIVQDFNTVYTYDNYVITPDKKNITVELSNEQCKLLCTYDKNHKFISYEEKDSAVSKFGAIFVSLLGGCLFTYVGTTLFAIVLPFILYYLLVFLEWFCLLLVGRRY